MSHGAHGGSVAQASADRITEIAAIGPDPLDAGIALEPGLLTAGECPQPADRFRLCLLERDALLEVAEKLPVADRLASRARQAGRSPGQGTDLLEEAAVELGLEPLGEPAVELGSVECEPDHDRAGRTDR